MKEKFNFFKIVFVILVMFNTVSCIDYPDFDTESMSEELILKSANGYSSELGEFYVQRGVATVLYLEGRNYDIMSATWEINDEKVEGKQIVYTFNSTISYDIEVEATMSNGEVVNKTFVVNCIVDLSEKDPIKSFVLGNDNDKWQLLFLFSKERMSESNGSYYNYIGTMTDWDEEEINSNDENYIINSDGEPERVDDVGKYLGVNFELENYSDEHEIAIVLDNGDWVDLSGSNFVKNDNKTKAIFYFDSEAGEVIPQGDYSEESLPGESGDMYMRFKIDDENLTVYFLLKDGYTNKSFCKYQKDDGTYTSYRKLEEVSSFSAWGSYSFNIASVRGKIFDLRYGQDYDDDENYSKNMNKSLFYSEYFNCLRLSLLKIE
ncbi:MAG: hypothetical protein PF488_03655 [Patescibacteria group bacterium]|jgi:hypothetical protein|nr:hypothetical protein [Patescibacteria group bacterium]